MVEQNQTNGGLKSDVDVAASYFITNEKGKIERFEGRKVDIPFTIVSEDTVKETANEMVINVGYNQIVNNNGQIVRVSKDGIILQHIKEEKYNEIYRKHQETIKANNKTR